MNTEKSFPIFCKAERLENSEKITPSVAYDGDDVLIKGALSLFARDFEKYHGIKIEITASADGAGITLCRKKAEELVLPEPSVFEECGAENYGIVLENGKLILNYIGIKSLNHALSALLRCAQVKDGQILWEFSDILDGPQCKYRSLLVDLGKYFHPIEYLYEYIDLCFMNNLSQFQVHFNDWYCYCLPSKLYPDLPTKDKHYTFEDIRELNSYALRRGITLVPEIDIPGHCNAFQEPYPELFGSDGIISMHDDSMAAVRGLIDEICDMFPYSEYFHIGGDEADIKKWTECDRCLEYFEKIDAAAVRKFREDGDSRALSERMLAGFITECADAVKKNGRTPIVWEGFNKCVNEHISRDITVMSWENYYQTTGELLDAGFNIINCSWNPLYIVTPKTMWSPEEIFDWNIYKWSAIHPDSPYYKRTLEIDKSFKNRIWGAQMHAWDDRMLKDFEDTRTACDAEKELVAQRLPAFSVNVWNTLEQKENYKNK